MCVCSRIKHDPRVSPPASSTRGVDTDDTLRELLRDAWAKLCTIEDELAGRRIHDDEDLVE